MGRILWFTNLETTKRHENIVLYKKYVPEEFPKYDNYNAINIDKVSEIPMNYNGVMGVPITFVDKFNPKQFELLGIMNTGEKNIGIRYKETPHGRPLVNGVEKYLRILIRAIKLKNNMKIDLHKIQIREVIVGYKDSAEEGVVAYRGRLDIRPKYQREFVYKEKQRNAVIETIKNSFPLNVMYWMIRDDGGYEVLDGQQRTISIGQYVTGDFSLNDRFFII